MEPVIRFLLEAAVIVIVSFGLPSFLLRRAERMPRVAEFFDKHLSDKDIPKGKFFAKRMGCVSVAGRLRSIAVALTISVVILIANQYLDIQTLLALGGVLIGFQSVFDDAQYSIQNRNRMTCINITY